MSDNPDPDVLRRLEEAVANLPYVQREVFLSKKVDKLRYADIASRLGITEQQVRRHMAKALLKLLKQMDGRKLNWWERRF